MSWCIVGSGENASEDGDANEVVHGAEEKNEEEAEEFEDPEDEPPEEDESNNAGTSSGATGRDKRRSSGTKSPMEEFDEDDEEEEEDTSASHSGNAKSSDAVASSASVAAAASAKATAESLKLADEEAGWQSVGSSNREQPVKEAAKTASLIDVNVYTPLVLPSDIAAQYIFHLGCSECVKRVSPWHGPGTVR